jgi:Ca2+-binding EF-hand superfamily protein
MSSGLGRLSVVTTLGFAFVAAFAAATLLRDVDPDMSGKISFEEFVRLLNKSRST